MSRKKIVAGNWKMNTDLLECIALIDALNNSEFQKIDIEKIIFPPFPFLKTAVDALQTKNLFLVGAQNQSEHEQGAFTGEVSAKMLASIGCKYVLVGHSERRIYFNETDKQLTQKIKQALSNNLQVIYCIGEQLEDRRNNNHFEVVKQQLRQVLIHFSEQDFNFFSIAYEPVWAIGTGETASPQQAQEMHAFIRKVICELSSRNTSDNIRILYGGSCNAQNAKELFSCEDVDGGLIGGASLKAVDFCKIINSF